MRMLIVGDCLGLRSERHICEEVNLAYRWFYRLGLDGKMPDYSTFSQNRYGRFRQSDILRPLFEAAVEHCLAEGLVGVQALQSMPVSSLLTPTSSASCERGISRLSGFGQHTCYRPSRSNMALSMKLVTPIT